MSLLTKIRELCSSKGITLAELERLSGLSPNTLRRWDTSTPSVDKVEVVANFFHVSVDYLLEREVKDESEFILARKLQQTE